MSPLIRKINKGNKAEKKNTGDLNIHYLIFLCAEIYRSVDHSNRFVYVVFKRKCAKTGILKDRDL